MVALKLIRTLFLCLLLSAASDFVSADTKTETNSAAAVSVDLAQRQEIQSMLDLLTGSPEIEVVIASRTKISEYISINRQKAAQIEKEIDQLEAALKGVVDLSPDQKIGGNSALSSLITMKQQKERELVELRLLTITGEEAIIQLNRYIRERETRDTYFREKPLWRLTQAQQGAEDSANLPKAMTASKPSSMSLFCAVLTGLVLFLAAVPRINRFISAQSGKKSFPSTLVNLISHSSRSARFLILPFTVLSAAVFLSSFIFSQWPIVSLGIQVIFFYLVLRLVLQALVIRFHSSQSAEAEASPCYKPGWVHYAFSLLSAFTISSALGFDSGITSGDLSLLTDFIFFSAWLILLFLFCRQAAGIIKPGSWNYCRPVLMVALLLLIFFELVGYRNLNEHLIALIGHSFFIFCVGLIIYDSIDLLMVLLHNFTTALLERFSLKPGAESSTGGAGGTHRLLGIGLKVYVILIGAALIFHRWSVNGSDNDLLMNYFINGWNIGGFTISPVRLTLGILLFTLAWPAVGYLKQLIDRHWLSKSEMSSSSRDTVLTLAGYGGFAAVIVISLGIAGVRLTGLTVIVGALSVGIGFGLQNIVSNFISGLILMFERPIKKGDWIQVGTTEGYVKKISIRSTIVQTFDRSDVIVPNSELISSQVTNMMFDDQRGRLRISVGVAYGSDTELVQRLLLEVAHSHDQVINDGSTPEPRALFQAFGESSLDFDLLVHLKDVDIRIRVRSEMHTMIDKAFRTHDIEIPFPQRDVHLQSGGPLNQKG